MQADRRNGRDPRLTVLYLRYPTGPGYRGERSVRALHRILSRLPGSKTLVTIDNSACRSAPEQLGADEYAIGGDNSFLEFSGWQRGVDFLRERGIAGDVCLLANDMLVAQSRSHRWLLNQAAVACARRYEAMVGRRVVLPAGGQILGNPLIPHVRTHLFLLPHAVLDELGSVVSLDRYSVDRLLLPAFDPAVQLFRPDAPISESIRDTILLHLHSSWHRRVPYTAEHFDTLRGKAISILNSLLLSMRVHELGHPLVSLARAARVLRADPARARLRAEWLDGTERRPAPGAPGTNPFWQADADAYRRVPEKARAFSLENVLDFVERRKHPEHL